MTDNPRLADIPDALLLNRTASTVARLHRWINASGMRPTLLEIEQERARRKETA